MGAAYRNDDEQVHIGWDITGITRELLDAGLYICLYKKWNDDDIFRFVKSLNIDETSTVDSYMSPGDKAEYRLRVRSKDGRISPYSNMVEVTVPHKEEITE